MFDGQKFGAEIVDLVKDYVSTQLAPVVAKNAALRARIEALETREPPPPGPSDEEVRSIVLAAVQMELEQRARPEEVRELVTGAVAEALPEAVSSAVREAVAALPVPKDGESVDPEAVREMVDAAVAARVPEAKDVAIALTASEDAPLLAAVRAQVDALVAEIPVPKDGESVDPAVVEQLVTEKVAAAVAALPVPLSVREALLGRDGNLVVTYSDGSTQDLGVVVGKDADMGALERRLAEAVAAIPVPKDGVSLTLDDFDIVPNEDGRTIEMKFTQGNTTHTFELVFPVPIYRDVWREGEVYQRGDMVSFGGSLWHAQQETKDRPASGETWRLAVRRGRDGKNAESGIVPDQVKLDTPA